MKRHFLITAFISLSLAAYSVAAPILTTKAEALTATPAHTVTPTRTQSPTTLITPSASPTFVFPANATPFSLIPPFDWSKLTSLDHQWEVSGLGKHPITVTSISDHKSYQEPDHYPSDEYIEFISWFPDCSGFVMVGVDHGCEKCSYDRLIAYQMDPKNNRLRRYVYEPVAERNTAFWPADISWSPDGLYFAVIVANREIDILDRETKVVHKIFPELKNHLAGIVATYWTSLGLFYLTTDGHHFPDEIRTLRSVDPTQPNPSESSLFASNGYPEISFFSIIRGSAKKLVDSQNGNNGINSRHDV